MHARVGLRACLRCPPWWGNEFERSDASPRAPPQLLSPQKASSARTHARPPRALKTVKAVLSSVRGRGRCRCRHEPVAMDPGLAVRPAVVSRVGAGLGIITNL